MLETPKVTSRGLTFNSKVNLATVKQEKFATGKFREFSESRGPQHYIFATENFRESADFRENREIFLRTKISCFTVSENVIYFMGTFDVIA